MKKIIFVMAVLTAILNAGIVAEGISKNGNIYTVSKVDGGSFRINMESGDDRRIRNKSTTVKADLNVLKTQLNAAAKQTKKMGYNYFVVTNSNVNNLNGFPLNNYKNLGKFLTLKKRKPSFATNAHGSKPSSLVAAGAIYLRFKPVPSSMLKNGLVSVWSVKQTLRDTK